VYYHEIKKFAEIMRCDAALVLAVAMAHEIGHLLLGTVHSRTGIMSAGLTPVNLELAKRGSLIFTPDQARVIRAKITALPAPTESRARGTRWVE
jgi:hypothetical protein